jgi:ParB-like chromosome segregation protein Spo0J
MNTVATSEAVLISTLLRDPRFQVRKKLDAHTVSRYASAFSSGRPMPPIKVARIEGALVVVDGWHRLAALERIGRHEVEAEIM